ncbi:MAG TPA: lytic transglycosylase domain-containing protein [Lacunisphaera sp.]|nr:lytic transglycosylase domain-containing protein [Lacunisphaera sp.]
MSYRPCLICILVTLAASGGAAESVARGKADPAEEANTPDALYELGKGLFEAFASEEVKAEYEFPDRAQWDAFTTGLQAALAGDDPAALAGYENEARAALATLRLLPGSEEYQDWLGERLDYIEAAKEMVRLKPVKPPAKRSTVQFIPDYDLWVRRLQSRPRPPLADKYVPGLQRVFAAGGVPGQLVWLAEVESSFNPTARSPVGARGLFQLMPATARELGLRTALPDERTDPRKSAEAAARMLKGLHAKFGDWPLALAAYNAGPGRVQRTLEKQRARTFAEIAHALPLETRMYVPKVLAVLQVRTGVSLAGTGRR